MHYVYYLISSIDNSIFYVGKGSGTRMFKHIEIAKGTNEKLKSRNPHLYRKINEIVRNGGTVICQKIYESVDENEAYKQEELEISQIGLENLTNIHPGGKGGKGGKRKPWTEERKQKLRETLKKNPRPKRKMTDEQRERLSKSLKGKAVSYWKGKKLSDETKEKMRKSAKGKHSGPISEKRRLAIIEGIRKKKNSLETESRL